jgi:hypothetical protein
MSIAAYPGWPIRLESLAGDLIITFPTYAMEWETGGELRTAFADVPLADYAFDLLGTRPAPRGATEEAIRFVIVGQDAQDAWRQYMDMRSKLARIGRGRLWIRDAVGTQYWCYARPLGLANTSLGIEQTRIIPISLRLQRLSDWYAAQEQQLTRIVRASPDNVLVTSQGTVETRKLVLTLRPEPIQSGLTVSGTVITDALRSQTTPAHFDGRQPESSVGIWRGTTNLVTNGGFETNTNGWTGGGATISRDTTRAVHGIACLRVVTNGGSGGQGATTPGGRAAFLLRQKAHTRRQRGCLEMLRFVSTYSGMTPTGRF